MDWTLDEVIKKLNEIKAKGFIPVPAEMHRTDDGIVGQILEREFGIAENNLPVGDLGTFELKGLRKKSSNITLSHKKGDIGLTPIEIFNRFGYIAESKRTPGVYKKKFFPTIRGDKMSKYGLRLRGICDKTLDMYYHAGDPTIPFEMICEWDLTEKIKKMNKVILVIADTTGKTNATDEMFHFTKAYLLEGLKPIKDLIDKGILVIEFSVDQSLDENRNLIGSPHDRGPHIRIAKTKLKKAYEVIREIM